MSEKIKVGGRLKFREDDMVLLEGTSNYTLIYTKDGQRFMTATNLGLIQSRMSHRFFRTHKKYLVNISQINDIENYKVILKNEQTILLARRRKADLLKAWEGEYSGRS